MNKHIVSNFRLPDNLEIFNAKNLKMQIPTPLEFSLYVLTEAEKVGGENLNPHWSFSVLNFELSNLQLRDPKNDFILNFNFEDRMKNL